MHTPVKFSLAKLLKEKGFDKDCRHFYEDEDLKEAFYYRNHNDSSVTVHSAPTIAEVVMWFYEKHGIWITVDYSLGHFSPFIKRQGKKAIPIKHWNFFSTPTEAYEAAIESTLKNLIP